MSVLVAAVRATVPRLRDALQTSRKYFTQFCIKFSSHFIPKYIIIAEDTLIMIH